MSHELVVVGAGPAGVSAALWAKAYDLDVVLLDAAERPGGQLHAVHFHPHDVPGFEAGDGAALAAAYARQLAASAVPVRTGARATALEAPDDPAVPRVVALAGGERLGARAVLVATGVRRRRLGVPGESELSGLGVSTSGTRDRARLAGRRVVVIGGGDAAFENALMLARTGGSVTLLVRGVARARAEFRTRVAADPAIRVLEGVRVVAFVGDRALRGVRIEREGRESTLEAEGAVVKVGVVPNGEWCAAALERDEQGYVRVDASLATSAPGVWAAGDITRPQPPSIPVAQGQGAQAGAAIRAALRGA